MFLTTATKERWDFWYQCADWVLAELQLGNMRQDVIGASTTTASGTARAWTTSINKPKVITSLSFEDTTDPQEWKNRYIRTTQLGNNIEEDLTSPASSFRFIQPGKPRKAGWRKNPGNLTIFIGPEAQSATERAYTGIIHFGAALAEFGGPQIPDGDFGLNRQEIGAKFMADYKKLLREWRR